MEQSKIYPALIGVMSDIGAIGKEKKNQQQGFMYRGIDDVMNALQPALVKNKVIIFPEIIEEVREERQTKTGGVMFDVRLKMRFTFAAEDGSNIQTIVIGEAMDTGDKATNKAMSVAYKYACFQTLCIPTEEMQDPDKTTPEEVVKKPNKDAIITQDERQKMFTLAEKALGDTWKSDFVTIVREYGYNSTENLTKSVYEAIVKRLNDSLKRK